MFELVVIPFKLLYFVCKLLSHNVVILDPAKRPTQCKNAVCINLNLRSVLCLLNSRFQRISIFEVISSKLNYTTTFYEGSN